MARGGGQATTAHGNRGTGAVSKGGKVRKVSAESGQIGGGPAVIKSIAVLTAEPVFGLRAR
jgi:hypothetical protein